MSYGNIGPYELRGELGRGAMARVWRAWDPNLEREVAIKEPLLDEVPSASVREEMGRRFVKEAKAAAKLNHPNVVSVFAADIYDGRPAIVMELVEGATLDTILERSTINSDVALDILNQMLDGIGYAHAQGIVHRDLKPANIFVRTDGVVKIGDFGIAHVDGGQTHATQMGTVLGTPGYMSPEQARGTEVDARSDLFSIGVIAYEMLTGSNPFGAGLADSTTILYRIVHEPAPDLAASSLGLPSAMAAAIMCALQKDPAARPATAAAFKAMLNGGVVPTQSYDYAGGSGSSKVGDVVRNTSRPAWLPYALVAVAGVVILAIIFFMATSGSSGGGAVTGGNSNNVTAVAATVPDVKNMTEAEAIAKLESAGFVAKKGEDVTSSSVEAGKVRTQSPSGGADAMTGDTVTYQLSKGSGSVLDQDYILADSATRTYSTSEVSSLSLKELCLARNEIFARHGYQFKTDVIQEYFDSKSWYKGTCDSSTFTEANLSSVEKANVSMLKSLEQAQNSPYLGTGFTW